MEIKKITIFIILSLISILSFSQNNTLSIKTELDSLNKNYKFIPRDTLIGRIEAIQKQMNTVSPKNSLWIDYFDVTSRICSIRELNRLALNIIAQTSEKEVIKKDSFYYPMLLITSAIFFKHLGIVDSSKLFNEKALVYAKKYHQNIAMHDAYVFKGTSFQTEGNQIEAVQNFLLADSLLVKIDDKDRKGALYYNLANSYFELQDLNNSLKYFKKAAKSHGKGSYLYEMDTRAIGIVYMVMDSLVKAEEYLLKVDGYLKDSPQDRISNLIIIQQLQHKLGKHKKSLESFKKLSKINSLVQDKNLAESIKLAVLSHLELGDLSNAESVYRNNKALLLKNGEFLNLSTELPILLQKESQNLRNKYERLMSIKDSTNKELIENKAIELNEKYQSEKKEAEIAELHQKQELKDIKLNNQRLLILLSLVGLMLFASLSYILYRKAKHRKETNLELKEKNEELKSYNTELIKSLENTSDGDALEQYLTLSNRQKTSIKLENIVYVESKDKAIYVYDVDGKTYKDWQSLKSYSNILPTNHFSQINRSTIVNNNHILSKQKKSLTLEGEIIIPIGLVFR